MQIVFPYFRQFFADKKKLDLSKKKKMADSGSDADYTETILNEIDIKE